MPEITLKAIEELLDRKLDEKLDAKLIPIKTGMSKLATGEELHTASTRLDSIQATLDQHTTALDAIAKNTGDWQGEITIMRNRMERYETALKVVAEKAGLDIKQLLQ